MINKIYKAVKENLNTIAYIYEADKISYSTLWNEAYKYGNLLKRQGIKPVIIYGHKKIEMLISILACIIAKRTYIPVDTCTPIDRIKKIIQITDSTLIITIEDIKIANIESLRLNELEKYSKNNIQENHNDIIYTIFTSGSTGTPKGVPISNDNLLSFTNWISDLSPLKEYKKATVLNQASFSFDLSVADIFYSLCNGHTLIGLDKNRIHNYNMLEIIKEANVIVSTPTFIKLCMIDKDFNEYNFPLIKCIYFCGEQLEVKLVKKIFERFPNIRLINAYGPTEATSAVSAIEITKNYINDEILPVGDMTNLATDVSVVDDEIILKGKSVFNGYLDNIIGGYYSENGINCYKTGDLGYIKDNKLYCKGRKDDQIKFKGYRIEISDIENNLKNIKGVSDCVVVAKKNENGLIKFIKAYVVIHDITLDEIKNELQHKIPLYMMPTQFESVKELPMNCNAKIDRKGLSEL